MGIQSQARPGERRAAAQRERELTALAQKQHGVVARRQLVDAGLGARTIQRRIEAGRLHRLHRGVYSFGGGKVNRRGAWLAAVLARGEGAVLSHRSAAALWGLIGTQRGPIDVTCAQGRPRHNGIRLHQGGVHREERKTKDGIPVTSVARTLFDFADLGDLERLRKAWEEADRLGLLRLNAVAQVCERGYGRHALAPIRRLLAAATAPAPGRSPLEHRFAEFCREHLGDLPAPHTNVTILDHEVDAYWAQHRLVIEMDSWEFHRHQAAFERDRRRDAAMQAAGYRVLRLTDRRLKSEAPAVAAELRALLAAG
jgi:very-short-patch-repair endonuclease